MQQKATTSQILIQVLLLTLLLLFLAISDWWGCNSESIVGSRDTLYLYPQEVGGIVVDADEYLLNDSLKGIEGVNVEILGSTTSTTNSIGWYSISNNVPLGKYKLKFTKSGYATTCIDMDSVYFRIGIPTVYMSKLGTAVTIDGNGGVVQNNDMTLIVPPGALSAPAQIGLSRFPLGYFIENQNIQLNAVNLVPENLSFNIPVTLCIKTPPELQNFSSLKLSVYKLNESSLIWGAENDSVSFGTDSIKVYLTHFSTITILTNLYLELQSFLWNTSGSEEIYKSETQIARTKTYRDQTYFIASFSLSYSKEYNCFASFGNLIAFNIGYREGFNQFINIDGKIVPECTDFYYFYSLYRQRMFCIIRFRICAFSNAFCTPWVDVGLSKSSYRLASGVISTPHTEGNCHDQGGGLKK